jgi:hypothetical protein
LFIALNVLYNTAWWYDVCYYNYYVNLNNNTIKHCADKKT